MMHIDEKFKDNSPVKTVENIRRLLLEHGIEVEEKWNDSGVENCHSMRLTIAGTTLGTNGKGVTRELARASGHAELMERLQSGYCGTGLLEIPDAVQMTREELLKLAWFEPVAARIAEVEQIAFSVQDLADACVAYGEINDCKALPFLDVTTGEKVNVPYYLLNSLYTTNGLAAGNSLEEAIVQGFSEIVERYCQRYFLEGKLTPPDVPEDYLANCETAYSVIKQVREAGYDVIIKDCSMGDDYPVVASAIINPKDRSSRVMFGASPVFEIALERSLTEVFQGCAIHKMPFVQGFFVGKKRPAKDVEAAYVGGWANYPYEFYAQNASYDFKAFEDRSHLTNKDLLAYIKGYLRRNNRKMLLRDMSHLGFHTYRILVPGMSELSTFMFAGEPSLCRVNMKSRNIRGNLKKASFEELTAYKTAYYAQPVLRGNIPTFISMSKVPLKIELQQDHFLTLMSMAFAAWGTDDRAEALDFALQAKQYVGKNMKDYIECLCRMIEIMLQDRTADEAAELMIRFYHPFVLEGARRACLSANPFGNLIFTCDRICESCPHASRCKQPENAAVTEIVNRAAAAFDQDAAFARLRECFSE